MECQSHYCIYNRNFICMLEEIEINSLAMCEECIIAAIPDEDLEQIKEKQLHNIRQRL